MLEEMNYMDVFFLGEVANQFLIFLICLELLHEMCANETACICLIYSIWYSGF